MNEQDLITEIETLRKSLRQSNEEGHELTLALEEVRREAAGLQRQVGLLLEQQGRHRDEIARRDGVEQALRDHVSVLTEELAECRSCLSEDAGSSYTVEVCYREVQAQSPDKAVQQVTLWLDEAALVTAVFDSDGVQVWSEDDEQEWPGPVELPKLHHDNTYQGEGA